MTTSRKELKKRAKATLKRHYLLLLVLCLLASFAGLEYTGELGGLGLRTVQGAGTPKIAESGTTQLPGISGVWYLLSEKDDLLGVLLSGAKLGIPQENEIQIGSISLGRSRGVLASVVNLFSSGSVPLRVYMAIRNTVGAGSIATGISVILTLLAYLAVVGGVISVLYVIFRRLILEARIYDRVPHQRWLFLLRMGRWFQSARTILLTALFLALWSLTIVGWIIKFYSYRMVSYIVAENPTIGSRQAITLSRRMMDGHKWECFKLDASFLLWYLLSFVTLGLVGIFFTNPYHTATMAEYYSHLRQQAKESKLEGSELLWDDFLFEKAEPDILQAAYKDLGKPVKLPRMGFLADNFGIALSDSRKEHNYTAAAVQNARYERYKLAVEGNAYPDRLSPVNREQPLLPLRLAKVIRATELVPGRHYSLASLGIIFFLFSMVGWVWEVALHLIETGEFVNRGTMYGPWLPIYGVGALIVLTLLFRFRTKPLLEFSLTVVLCGVVEYFTGWFLEITHNGTKWWDYSGYFLNINSRVCAEGLLAFGILGLMAVYMICPLVDNTLRRLPRRRVIAVTLLLLCLFTVDASHSIKHPNTGAGVTDITETIPSQSK